MKLRFIFVAGVATLFSLTAFSGSSLQVKVISGNCSGWLTSLCDYTPSNDNKNKLSDKSCGYKIYQKLLKVAPTVADQARAKFGANGSISLRISDVTGGKIGQISVTAAEDGFNKDGLITAAGVPCNIGASESLGGMGSPVTTPCYHDKDHISLSLPTPNENNSPDKCDLFVNQINEQNLAEMIKNTVVVQKRESSKETADRTRKPAPYAPGGGTTAGTPAGAAAHSIQN